MTDDEALTVGTHNEATRHAWIERTLRALPAGWRLLDAGAGEQPYRRHCAHLDYVCQDFAQYDPGADATGLQMPSWDYGRLDHVCDITAIPEPDASFDAVLCSEVFEHLPDPLAALREFARLLRPGGRLILTAPFCSLTHFAPHHYATGFGPSFYRTHLPACGLVIDELTPNGSYFEYLAQEVRRLREVSGRYADDAPTAEDIEGFKATLRFLQRCSARDAGSAELLCFGYHVMATRQREGSEERRT